MIRSQGVRRVLEVTSRVPCVIWVVTYPAYLVLELLSVQSAGDDLVKFIFVLSIDLYWLWSVLSLAREWVHRMLAKLLGVKYVVDLDLRREQHLERLTNFLDDGKRPLPQLVVLLAWPISLPSLCRYHHVVPFSEVHFSPMLVCLLLHSLS